MEPRCSDLLHCPFAPLDQLLDTKSTDRKMTPASFHRPDGEGEDSDLANFSMSCTLEKAVAGRAQPGSPPLCPAQDNPCSFRRRKNAQVPFSGFSF